MYYIVYTLLWTYIILCWLDQGCMTVSLSINGDFVLLVVIQNSFLADFTGLPLPLAVKNKLREADIFTVNNCSSI